MLHHVGIEIRAEEVERAVELFEALGFEQVEPPPSLREGFTWVERVGAQVHLMHVEDPVVPASGHVAVVVPAGTAGPGAGDAERAGFDAALSALRERGFDPEPRREHWGAPRALVILPGGQRVELMAFPPR
jgi:hypothetical protein